jgi:4-amino-4-deoxy-L-arabinose transferase-like glycosyltransferase
VTIRTIFAGRPVRIITFVLVFTWGLYQSAWNISRANTMADEPIYASAGWSYLHGDFTPNLEHPPTAKYLMGLAQLLLGEGIFAARVLEVVVVMAGGLITFLWLRREIGWYGGLLAGGMWLLLPRGILDDPTRIDRLALLDPIMVFFAVAAMASAWKWIRTGHWWWIASSGALMALSVTSKVSTAVILPAFLLLPLMFRRFKEAVIGGAVFVAALIVVFVAVYAPLGVRSAVGYMLTFQGKHAAQGHTTEVAGVVSVFPPWWAGLWFQVQGTGTLVTGVVIVGVLCALAVKPDRLVVFIATAGALLLGFYLFVASVTLPAYYYAWMWPVYVLAAIGYARLAGLRPRPLALAAAGVAIGVVAFTGARLSLETAHIRPEGIARVDAELDRAQLDGDRLLIGMVSPSTYMPFFGDDATLDAAAGPFDAVFIGEDDRFPVDPSLLNFIATNPEDFDSIDLDGSSLLIPVGGDLVLSATGYSIEPTP